MLVVGADEVPGEAGVWAMLHWAVKPKTTTSTPLPIGLENGAWLRLPLKKWLSRVNG